VGDGKLNALGFKVNRIRQAALQIILIALIGGRILANAKLRNNSLIQKLILRAKMDTTVTFQNTSGQRHLFKGQEPAEPRIFENFSSIKKRSLTLWGFGIWNPKVVIRITVIGTIPLLNTKEMEIHSKLLKK
jgi:hypothetical protein